MLMFMALCCREALAEAAVAVPMTASQKQGAVFLDTLSIPSPGEVFAALSGSSHPNWVNLVSASMAPITTERSQLALVVGVLAVNGYIAVEAQDGQQVKNIGREMIAVAKALGVSENLMGRGNSLMEFAQNNAWDSLADELEATENEVRKTMVDQKDHDLVILTSTAGWIRGLDVATGIVLMNPNLDVIEVIRQPELARHLARQLDSLPPRLQRAPMIAALQKTLGEIAPLLETMGAATDAERSTVQQIHEKAVAMVKQIMSSESKAASPVVAQPSPIPPAAHP